MRRLPLPLLFTLLLLFIFCAVTAFAESSKVYIISFRYENNELIVDGKLVKYGYSPDRRLAFGGYNGEVVSDSNDVLYSFNFDVPLTEFVDISNLTTGELSGGIVRLDKTRFALVLPYFENAKDVRIYNKDNDEILSINVEEKKGFSYLWLLIACLLIIVLFILLLAILKKIRLIRQKRH